MFGAADYVVRLERGILGLGIPIANAATTSIFDAVYKENLLDKPIFTLFFKKCPKNQKECENAGVVTLGGMDEKNCESTIFNWVPVLPYGGPW